MAALENPGYLVSTQWLHDHLDDDGLRILDVTAMLTSDLTNIAKEKCYDEGHIPGATLFDVASGQGRLSRKDADLPWTWPTPDEFQTTMEEFGISNHHRVVIVARTPREGIDSGTMWCTRAWWTLHHFGVECAILEGGLEKWESEGRMLTTDPPGAFPPAQFTVDPAWQRGCASKEDVLKAIDAQDTCLIDALPEASFNGSSAGYGPRKGHIAGAINRPYRDLIVGETAAFRTPDELTNRLHDLLGEQRVMTYCGGAIAATVNAFAFKLLGHPDVSVYDGSLMEWSRDESLPMSDPSQKSAN